MYNFIYKFKISTDAIIALIEAKKLNFRIVCNATNIHPSYFSRVVKGNAFFSQNQIFKISQFLELPDEPFEFLILLLNHDLAEQTPEKNFYLKKIRAIHDSKLKVSKNMKVNVVEESPDMQKHKIERYYASAITALIHMYLTIPKYQKDPKEILKKVLISEKKLEDEMTKLSELKLIEIQNHKIIKVQNTIHLDESSHLSFQNHINWRLKTIQNLENKEPQLADYHLSVVISANEETKHKLKQILRDAVLTLQKEVIACEQPTDIYHIQMDLF